MRGGSQARGGNNSNKNTPQVGSTQSVFSRGQGRYPQEKAFPSKEERGLTCLWLPLKQRHSRREMVENWCILGDQVTSQIMLEGLLLDFLGKTPPPFTCPAQRQ